MTRTPLSRSKGQRSRSPGRFAHRCVGASGSCCGGRENVLAMGNCCYVAVYSAAQGASAPTGRRGAGAYRDGRRPTACYDRYILLLCVSVHVISCLFCFLSNGEWISLPHSLYYTNIDVNSSVNHCVMSVSSYSNNNHLLTYLLTHSHLGPNIFGLSSHVSSQFWHRRLSLLHHITIYACARMRVRDVIRGYAVT